MKSSFNIRYHHDIVTRPVKINIFVKQQTKLLYHKIIDLRSYYSPLRIEFEFDSLDSIELVFSTDCTDMDLFPFYVDRIELDDLADFPFIAHGGVLIDGQKNYIGNCLYCDRELTYKFELPFCKIYNIHENKSYS